MQVAEGGLRLLLGKKEVGPMVPLVYDGAGPVVDWSLEELASGHSAQRSSRGLGGRWLHWAGLMT